MNINKVWDLTNKMPKKATLDQRIKWHVGHSKNCSCRPMPEKIQEEIKKKGY